MKKSTRRAWSQEDIDWLKNEFHDWKKSYIQTNFSGVYIYSYEAESASTEITLN